MLRGRMRPGSPSTNISTPRRRLRWALLLPLGVACGGAGEAPPAPPPEEPACGAEQAFSAEGLRQRADEAERAGDPAAWLEVEELARDMARCTPDRPEAWLTLARTLQRREVMGMPFGPAAAETGEARAAFERALELDPSLAPALEGLAEHWFYLRDHREALRWAEAYAERAPEDHGGTLLRARCLRELGELERAEALLRELLAAEAAGSPTVRPELAVQARDHLGRILMAWGRLEEAEAILVESGAQLLDTPSLRRQYYGCPFQALGELYIIAGQHDAAAASYATAAELEAVQPTSQLQAAAAAGLAGDTRTQQRYLERARALGMERIPDTDPRGPVTRTPGAPESSAWEASEASMIALAILSFDEHRLEAARSYARAAGSTSAEGRVLLGFVALLGGDDTSAREHFLAAGDDPGGAVGLAHLALGAKDNEGARGALGALAAAEPPEDPYSAFLWRYANLGLAWAAANEARHALAIEHYDRVLAVSPDEGFSLLGKGNALTSLGRLQDAELLFERALALRPDNPFAHAELGLLHYNRGELEAAERRFERALALEPDGYTCPHEGLGLVYLQRGELAKAEEAFTEAIRINPDIEYKKYNGLAAIYLQQGRTEEARALLLASIENHPYDDEARRMLEELEAP